MKPKPDAIIGTVIFAIISIAFVLTCAFLNHYEGWYRQSRFNEPEHPPPIYVQCEYILKLYGKALCEKKLKLSCDND